MLGHHRNARATVPGMVRLLRSIGARDDGLVSIWSAAPGSNAVHAPSGHLCSVRRPHTSGHYRRSMTTLTTATRPNAVSGGRQGPWVGNRRRWFSQASAGTTSDKGGSKSKLRIHIEGERYGPREYMLLPSTIPLDDLDANDPEASALIRKYRIASLRANRNILFGAKCFALIGGGDDAGGGSSGGSSSSESLIKACSPLVKAALNDASSNGEQPQALASLDGLCAWVESCLDGQGSKELEGIVNQMEGGDEDAKCLYEAVKAIATGQPRPGHSVLGAGTYRDGQPLWEKLAREYAEGGGGPDMVASEVELYRTNGMEIVAVEHLADTSEKYLASAGGAMVRLFHVV